MMGKGPKERQPIIDFITNLKIYTAVPFRWQGAAQQISRRTFLCIFAALPEPLPSIGKKNAYT